MGGRRCYHRRAMLLLWVGGAAATGGRPELLLRLADDAAGCCMQHTVPHCFSWRASATGLPQACQEQLHGQQEDITVSKHTGVASRTIAAKRDLRTTVSRDTWSARATRDNTRCPEAGKSSGRNGRADQDGRAWYNRSTARSSTVRR
jgi:hypothetical protein